MVAGVSLDNTMAVTAASANPLAQPTVTEAETLREGSEDGGGTWDSDQERREPDGQAWDSGGLRIGVNTRTASGLVGCWRCCTQSDPTVRVLTVPPGPIAACPCAGSILEPALCASW